MSISMDAREILCHLNKMGYKSITAEQLKEFMRDLKKLIKYDKTNPDLNCLDKEIQFENAFNLLHETTTVSSRAKLQKTNSPAVPPNKQLDKVKDVDVRDDNNKENIKPTEVKNSKKTEMEPKTSKMWIRPNYERKTIPKNDPVTLYHAYQRDWERFRHCLPGENDHSELRWAIRTKFLTDSTPIRTNRAGKRL